MRFWTSHITVLITLTVMAQFAAYGQEFVRELAPEGAVDIEVVNLYGRVDAVAAAGEAAAVTAKAADGVAETEIKIETVKGRTRISVEPASKGKRIDISLRLPERARLRITTREGEVMAEGSFEWIEAETDTGTIAVDVPTDDVRYELNWLASRPRYVADFELEPVKERSAGRFRIKGRYRGGEPEPEGNGDAAAKRVEIRTRTQRGIVLINVPPNEVTSDLRERPLTEAAKAIIRSGDPVLMDAIRRAAPKYFGDYERTLPPWRREPELLSARGPDREASAGIKRATVHVTDNFNRAIAGLGPGDFEVTENGAVRDILSVRPVDAPVNLVLLLDVSGSIENYVTFIRKAGRAFVDTVDKRDRISIVTFNEDVKVLSGFTTDKRLLSESLDSFDAGGPTAYYDALAYTLAESLRPLAGERTAIVVLTDGDDNRSFLAFDPLIGAIEESGALIYPLYVPSSLIAASAASGYQDIDPLRNRHLTLTSKSDDEGRRLARVSGGQYYPITQLSQVQTAYEDIVVQLRTAYDVTYRSELPDDPRGMASPRMRVRVKRENAFVQIGPVVPVRK
jgi:VWFA-related protein